ncbi:MAG TPA: pantoate--beta-alanine ligase [Solirubrobacteraceae bacterium]|jgi:pantoate--beta-alanine ligase|nr:pantoate--beta-alanine ligase [Solirubrobacteraceae bacterium]
MRIIRQVSELRPVVSEARRAGDRVGLVPTMGALHEGHLSLMRQARRDCDLVVASLFVNPAQFNDLGDLQAYPRDEARDARLAAQVGVDVLFAPPPDAVYPAGFATTVSIAGLTERLEGVSRGRGHFDGVTTVVTKLLNMVAPDVAYFGQKDAQQVMVIKRLVRDLDLPVQIAVCPTVREPDGLAMSSRNAHLSPGERRQALSVSRSLRVAAAAVADGERDPAAIRRQALEELAEAGVQPEYFELVSPETFDPIHKLNASVLAVVAARVGGTRLIDNQMLTTTESSRWREAKGRETSMYGMNPKSTVEFPGLVA